MTAAVCQRWDPADYAVSGAFVPALGQPVVDLLGPKRGERILDLGCGNGTLTAALVEAGALVIGIDASPEMVGAARARGLDASVMDGQGLTFDGLFDAAFSNAALHWMHDQQAVAAGVFRALKPGGRFVGELGGEGNVAALDRALADEMAARGRPITHRHQWYPSVDEFEAIYDGAGFEAVRARLIPRPTPLRDGAAAWYRTFRRGVLDAAALPDEDAVLRAAVARVAPFLRRADGVFVADYVRLRFTMRKPL